MTYEEAVLYLESFVNYEKKPEELCHQGFRLERIKAFLDCLSNPQDDLKVIHVAGTKGKGSTASFIAQILKENGFAVGLYTSPHLQDIRERIRVLDIRKTAQKDDVVEGMISEFDFAGLMTGLVEKIEAFCLKFDVSGRLSYFEALTVLAIQYFKKSSVDFAVLETGLGGRLDATNIVPSLVSVITPISYDHEYILGNTLAEIAFEKAGIIKPENVKTPKGVLVAVTALQKRDVRGVLRRRAKTEGSVLFELGKDFFIKRLGGNLLSQEFFYKGLHDKHLFLKTKMLGGHQLVNASLALACCEALSLHGIKVKKEAMAQGVLNAFWPGRLEIFKTTPFVILDGAHNEASALCLSVFLKKEFKRFRKWLLFGASCDKNIKMIAQELEPLFDEIILTRADHARAADPAGALRPHFNGKNICLTQTLDEAIEMLNQRASADDVIVVTGSLFLVGEARKKWRD